MKKLLVYLLLLVIPIILIADYNEILHEELVNSEGQDRISKLIKILSTKTIEDDSLFYQLSSELLQLSDQYIDISGSAFANYYLAKYEVEHNNYIAALEYQEEAIVYFSQLNDNQYELADLYTSRGVVLKNLGRYQNSLESYYKALEHITKVDDIGLEAFLHQGMGVTYWTLRHYEKALEHLEISNELAEKIDDKNTIAGNYTNIGNIHTVLGNYDISIQYYKSAIEILEEMPVSVYLSNTYHNLGLVSTETEEKHLSETYYQKSLDLFIETGYKRGEAFAYTSLAKYYLDTEQYDKALDHIHNSIRLREQQEDMATLSVSYRFAADIYLKLNDFENAKHYMTLALDLANSSEVDKLVAEALYTHADYHRKLDNYDEAFDYLEQHNEYQQKIFSDRNAEIKAQFETQYEVSQLEYEMENLRYEKQLNQFELSRNRRNRNLYFGLIIAFAIIALTFIRQNRIKIKTNKQLEKSYAELDKHKIELEELYEKQTHFLEEVENLNKTKDKLFSIVSHDLKNSLTSITTGTRMLSNDLDSLESEDIIMITSELRKNSDSLVSLLNNLLTWARAQLGAIEYEPRLIKIADVLESCISTFDGAARQKNISIETNISPEVHAFADKVMINSVFQNLISNALKFSNPDGKVEISADMDDQKTYITFKDHGIGMSIEQLEKIFDLQNKKSQRGTAGEKGTGLGLNLCKEFIEQNKGKLDISSTPGEGTTVVITLPKGDLE